MVRAALLRRSSQAADRFFCFRQRLSSFPLRHTPLSSSRNASSLSAASPCRSSSRFLRVAAAASISPSSSTPCSGRHFSSSSAATPPSSQRSSDVGVSAEVAEKLGFEIVSEQFIDEHKSSAVLFRHQKTGVEVMSLSNDDENKVFGIVFRTPPKDSTGLPHILQRSVLCGSRKYPFRKPFAGLIEGSCNKYLETTPMTFPDRTVYPIASRNKKEFYNLLDVYLDAVFFPKCVEDESIFQQQGWHFVIDDPSRKISYGGVVFNEMKYVYSHPDSCMTRAVRRAVFPDNIYRVDSRGDPKVIPNLTFQEFQEFHRKYYHPSNARIWFYGDDDPSERLRSLSEYLDMFESSSSPNESIILPQRLFSEPVRVVHKYPAGDGGDLKKEHMVCFHWLLSDKPMDWETELALGLLDCLLLKTAHISSLMMILRESGLGGASLDGGIEADLLQPQFSIQLKHISEEEVQMVEDLVLSALRKIHEEGFETDVVEAAMNIFEFSLRENNTESSPCGLTLMFKSIGKWIYDSDPFEPLKYEKPLMALKARIAKEGSKAVFSPLIEKFILNNKHCAIVVMQPDPKKASRDDSAERTTLEKLKASLTQEILVELARDTNELKLKQETPHPPEALKAIRCLRLDDIPKETVRIPMEVVEINGAKVLRHDMFTNGVLHVRVVFNMKSVKQELLPFVPLFCESLGWMDTKGMPLIQLHQLMSRKIGGGITASPYTVAARDPADLCNHVIISAKAMTSRAEDLFSLMQCVLEAQFLDKERFRELISQSQAEMQSQLCGGGGHFIAASRIAGKLTSSGWIKEQIGGISYFEFLLALEERLDQDWDGISASLEEIRKSLLSKDGCIISLTADEKTLAASEKYVSKFLDFLPTKSPAAIASLDARIPPGNEAFVIPSPVNYVCKAAQVYETGYQCNWSACAVINHINTTYLPDRMRQAGAAGAMCSLDIYSGILYNLSWGVPDLMKTFDVFDATGDFLRGLEVDDDALTRAIVGAVGEIDLYGLPSPEFKAWCSLLKYLRGATEEERHLRRQEILSARANDFKEFAEVIDAVKHKGVSVVLASEDSLDTAVTDRLFANSWQ